MLKLVPFPPAVESPLLITLEKPYTSVMNKGCKVLIHDSYSNIFKSSILSKCFRFKVARGILWAIKEGVRHFFGTKLKHTFTLKQPTLNHPITLQIPFNLPSIFIHYKQFIANYSATVLTPHNHHHQPFLEH